MSMHSLNITKGSLAGWTVKDAVVELIANAQDEDGAFTVSKNADRLEIRNRGTLRLRDFVMNPNQSKRDDPRKHGGFGYGLKDAIAVLLYHGIAFTAMSDDGVFTVEERAVGGVPTLHVRHEQPRSNNGTTTILLTGSDLPKQNDCVLDTTGLDHQFGNNKVTVYTREDGKGMLYVYMRGLYPAHEKLKNGRLHDVIVNFDEVPKSLQDKLGRDRKNRSTSHFKLGKLFRKHERIHLLPQPYQAQPQPTKAKKRKPQPQPMSLGVTAISPPPALPTVALPGYFPAQPLNNFKREAELAKELWLTCATSRLPSRGNFDEGSIEPWIQSKHADHDAVLGELHDLFKNFEHFVQGSALNGTQLTDSDIDFVVNCPPHRKPELLNLLAGLNQVAEPDPMPHLGATTRYELNFDNVAVDVLVHESSPQHSFSDMRRDAQDSHAPKTEKQILALLFFKRWRITLFGFRSDLPKSRVFQHIIQHVDPHATKSFGDLLMASLKILKDTPSTKNALQNDFDKHDKEEWEMVRAAADATWRHLNFA